MFFHHDFLHRCWFGGGCHGLHWQGFFLGFFQRSGRHKTGNIFLGRFGWAFLYGVVEYFAKAGWRFLSQGRFFSGRRRRQTVGFLARHKSLCQGDLGIHGFNINRNDQLGFASHLAGRDDKHVGAVQGNCLFVGRPGVTGNDSLEFHGVSRWSNKGLN